MTSSCIIRSSFDRLAVALLIRGWHPLGGPVIFRRVIVGVCLLKHALI